jgi:hypothetical protein
MNYKDLAEQARREQWPIADADRDAAIRRLESLAATAANPTVAARARRILAAWKKACEGDHHE